MRSIFGTDGIRGRFAKEIKYSLAYKVGYALGVIVGTNNPILIGRDTRISGEILFEAISRGIKDAGKEFVYLGICPTPAIPFLIKKDFEKRIEMIMKRAKNNKLSANKNLSIIKNNNLLNIYTQAVSYTHLTLPTNREE